MRVTRGEVLEALVAFGSPVSPAVLAVEMGFPLRRVQDSLAELWSRGLVDRDARGVYRPRSAECGYCDEQAGTSCHTLDGRPLCEACYQRVAPMGATS